jgi:hypothetical protein
MNTREGIRAAKSPGLTSLDEPIESVADFRCWHLSDMALELGDVRYWMDIVAKVFLGCRTKILRTADAFYAW